MSDTDVRIKLSLDGDAKVSSGLAGVGDSASKADSKLGSLTSKGLKGAGVALAGVATAAVAAGGVLGGAVINQFAQYEQNVGGIETMFGKSADKMQQYAADAYKTAGLSANEYMEQATSFSAALLQGLGGDTDKAADIANRAMTDMSDNANKFGTNIGLIQNAYQGFSKQNYTMLDNLKLGYGGTAAEMARLVNDAGLMEEGFVATAQNINDVSYDKIIASIGKIQDEMGITGTTAKEASETISGSLGMLRGAFDNLLTGLGSADADVATLAGNVITSLELVIQNVGPVISNIGDNLATLGPQLGGMTQGLVGAISDSIPALIGAGSAMVDGLIQGVASSLPGLIQAGVPALIGLVEMVVQNLPKLVDAGMKAVIALGQGLVQALPSLLPQIVMMVTGIGEGIMSNLPMLLQTGIQLVMALGQGILDSVPIILEYLPELIDQIVRFIQTGVPMLIEAGIELFTSIVTALPDIITQIVAVLPEIIESVITTILDAIPLLIDAGIELLVALVDNLPAIIQGIVSAIPKIITSVIKAIIGAIPKLVNAGIRLLTALIKNLPTIISTIVKAIPEIVGGILGALGDAIPEMISMGGDLIRGLWQGISDLGGWIMNQIGGFMNNIVGGIKSFFGIASPSKLMISLGKFIGQGLAKGLKGTESDIDRAAKGMIDKVKDAMKAGDISKAMGRGVIEDIKKGTRELKRTIRERGEALDELRKQRDVLRGMRLERKDFILDAGQNAGDSVNVSGVENTADMKKSLEEQAQAYKNFRKTMDQLLEWGLDDTTRDQLFEEFMRNGTTAGADALLAGGKADVKAIAALQEDLQKEGRKLGRLVGNDMFNAGIKAQEGLVKGLENDYHALDRAADRIAKRLVTQVKKGLKIKSPSRLFEDEVGAMVPAGLGLGVAKNEGLAIRPVQNLTSKIEKEAQLTGLAAATQIDTSFRSAIYANPQFALPTPSTFDSSSSLVQAIESVFSSMQFEPARISSQDMEVLASKVAQALRDVRNADGQDAVLSLKQGAR